MSYTFDNFIAVLTHWGRVTHICVGKQTIIGSDNGLSPGRRQAIIWTNGGILLIGSLGTNFSGISIKMLTFSFTKMRLKVSSAKWRPFCLGLNVLSIHWATDEAAGWFADGYHQTQLIRRPQAYRLREKLSRLSKYLHSTRNPVY